MDTAESSLTPQRAADAVRPRRGHGRLPRRERERLRQGRGPPGRRHPRLLRDPVLPGRRHLRRRLPPDHPQGRPQGRGPAVAARLLRPAAQRPDRPAVRDAALHGALGADPAATTSRTRPRPCTSPPGPRAPRPPSWSRCRSPRSTSPSTRRRRPSSQRLTTLAVVKDAEGRVVERFSDEYPLAGPLDQLEAAKQSNAVLRRTVPLASGRYTLETVSQVKGTGKTSVERASFEVPAAGERPAAQQPLPAPAGGPAARRRPALGRPVPLRGHAPRPAPRRAGEPGGDAEPVLLRAPLPARRRSSRRSSRSTSCATARSSAAPSRPCPRPTRAAGSPTSAACPRAASRPGAYEVRLTLDAGNGERSRTSSTAVRARALTAVSHASRAGYRPTSTTTERGPAA